MTLEYDTTTTGLLIVDPYNDSISEGGKVWEKVRVVAEVNQCGLAVAGRAVVDDRPLRRLA